MIASILMAIGMTISVLVEALLPSRGAMTQGEGGDDGKLENTKECLRNKLEALASLLGKLGAKSAKALSGIIGVIISCILNSAKEVVGWVLQNLWALVVGVGGLLYTYMVMRN